MKLGNGNTDGEGKPKNDDAGLNGDRGNGGGGRKGGGGSNGGGGGGGGGGGSGDVSAFSRMCVRVATGEGVLFLDVLPKRKKKMA